MSDSDSARRSHNWMLDPINELASLARQREVPQAIAVLDALAVKLLTSSELQHFRELCARISRRD